MVLPEEMSPKSHRALIIISISLFKAPGIIWDFLLLLFSAKWSNYTLCVLPCTLQIFVKFP